MRHKTKETTKHMQRNTTKRNGFVCCNVAHGMQLATQATFRAAWATSEVARATFKAAQAHCLSLTLEPDALDAHSLPMQDHPNASVRIRRPDADKSVRHGPMGLRHKAKEISLSTCNATQQRGTESMDTYTRDITRQHCKDHVAAHIILHPLIHVPKLYNCHKKTSSMYLYTEKII